MRRVELKQNAAEVIRFAAFVLVVLAAVYSLTPAARKAPGVLVAVLGVAVGWSIVALAGREVYIVDPTDGVVDVTATSPFGRHRHRLASGILPWSAGRSSFFRREHRIGDAMIHAYGLEIPRTLEEICDPKRAALLVYDMQVGILGQIKNGPTITAAVQRVVDAARAAGVRVIFTRHMSLPKELMGVFQLRMAMAWQRVSTVDEVKPWFLRDSPGFQLIPELSPRSTEAVLDKITMSAFEGTPLDIVLRDCGINAFVIVGVAMEVGIDPTVRHAADLGYIPVVVRDACGAGHEEAAQRSIASLEYAGDSVFTDVDKISALWSARPADHPAR